MYRIQQRAVLEKVEDLLRQNYGIELPHIASAQPPEIALGELALPLAFELAKRLRKAPRAIATELAEQMSGIEGIAGVEVAGAGYLNVRFERAAMVERIARGEHADVGGSGLRLVEHTSINPNKAAHVGHLRNAVLGDSFARMLRNDSYKSGYPLGVQNYIDNTGVQVADAVVGLLHLEGLTPEGVEALLEELASRGERIDFYLWELYARVSQWYEAEPAVAAERKQLRLDTLHQIEQGGNPVATVADRIATAVLRRHLDTMQRLGIEYDFLPRESEILHLHFWEAARQVMIDRGVLYQETEGKNKGCWVMRRAGAAEHTGEGPDEDAKVIVRSNGTVTYVGKDIAYHLWKFGLLPGKDFGYREFFRYPSHLCWISTTDGVEPHPDFGRAEAIYNVVDSRQNDPQENVREALRGMGFNAAAERFTHMNYAMVALTPRCAVDLGYTISDEDRARPYLEVSGRKGFGVKADDLIDRLIAAAQVEVDARNPDASAEDRRQTAEQIAVGALRYFMLKFTRNTVIAFDFRDALSFEGETGPYVQYAAVRAGNILRKAGVTAEQALAAVRADEVRASLTGGAGDVIWSVWLLASRLSVVLESAIEAAEPAMLARYAFQLAQEFNNFYHRTHVLTEADAARRTLLLATVAVARRELTQVLDWLGIAVPRVM